MFIHHLFGSLRERERAASSSCLPCMGDIIRITLHEHGGQVGRLRGKRADVHMCTDVCPHAHVRMNKCEIIWSLWQTQNWGRMRSAEQVSRLCQRQKRAQCLHHMQRHTENYLTFFSFFLANRHLNEAGSGSDGAKAFFPPLGIHSYSGCDCNLVKDWEVLLLGDTGWEFIGIEKLFFSFIYKTVWKGKS